MLIPRENCGYPDRCKYHWSRAVGAALMQNGKPVACASHSVTKSESNYAPNELECLVIVFAARKYDQYIFGHTGVTIQSDHKPLEAIARKSLLLAPRCLQSMLFALRRYSLKIEYRPGREHTVADMFSHLRNNGGKTEDITREEVFQTQVTNELLQTFEK